MRAFEYFIFLVSFCFTVSSCVEPFVPEVETNDPLMVVEGIITSKEERQVVRITLTNNYNEDFLNNTEIDAQVFVTDILGNRFDYTQHQPGYFYSNEIIRGHEGVAYTLNIETSDGELYQSDPQIMEAKLKVDSLDVVWKVREQFVAGNNGEQTLQLVEGVEFYVDIKSNNQSIPMIRFEMDLLVQYILNNFSSDPDFYYSHHKRNIDDKIILVLPNSYTENSSSVYQRIGFMKRSIRVPIPDTLSLRQINRRIIILRQYSLNQQSYQFYKQLSEQLEAEGTLFDPIPSQIKGNIHCITNPNKRALGLFEVSAFHSESFVLSSEPLRPENLSIKLTNDLNYLPAFSISRELIPDYWILF